MADQRFHIRHGPFTLQEIAGAISADLAPGSAADFLVHDIGAIETAGAGTLVFAQGRHVKNLAGCAADAAIVRAVPDLECGIRNFLLSDAPDRAFVEATLLFYPEAKEPPGIHPSAVVDPTAKLEAGSVVGANAVIGPNVEIGSGTRIDPGATICQGVAIGRHCRIGPNVSLMHCLIGNNVLIHSGTVVGEDGFGYIPGAEGHLKIPQLGRVIVQDRVEIGANATIDRGRLDDTVIGEGTKIDNLVHIAHNCRIGRHCIIAAQVGMSGSVTIGDYAVMFGQVGIADHVSLGAHSVTLAKAGISRSVPEGAVISGYPARPVKQWHREAAVLARLAKGTQKGGPKT